MQLIRIEYIDGMGVWRSFIDDKKLIFNLRIYNHSQFKNIIDRHSNPFEFPTFSEDDELNIQVQEDTISQYRFAFLSLDQLEKAFTKEELKELINDFGFKVYLIEVTACFCSSFQAIFLPENIIQKQDISFMFL